MKKAYLVTFAPCTRVVAEENATEEEITEAARRKMCSDPEQYITEDNCTYCEEDTAMPYDPVNDDKEVDQPILFHPLDIPAPPDRIFLATSNHGNHIGFNRKWKVEEVYTSKGNPLVDIALNVSDDHKWIDDNSDIEDTSNERYVGAGVYNAAMILQVSPSAESYEHDSVYYLIINENEIDVYAGDNGHYGGLYSKLCEIAGKQE